MTDENDIVEYSAPVSLSIMRKFKLGTMKVSPDNTWWKYAKIDFGICGKDTKAKIVYRNIMYGWIPVGPCGCPDLE